MAIENDGEIRQRLIDGIGVMEAGHLLAVQAMEICLPLARAHTAEVSRKLRLSLGWLQGVELSITGLRTMLSLSAGPLADHEAESVADWTSDVIRAAQVSIEGVERLRQPPAREADKALVQLLCLADDALDILFPSSPADAAEGSPECQRSVKSPATATAEGKARRSVIAPQFVISEG